MKKLHSADRGTENLPALVPPQNMGEALHRFVIGCPSLQGRTYLAELRSKIVSVLNSALKNDAYTERYTRETAAYGEKAGLHTDRVMELVSDDFCLGLSYIQQKKGNDVAKEYLEESDVETCVRIGKQLRTGFEEQLTNLREANNVLPPAKVHGTRGVELDKVSRPKLSYTLDLHVGEFNVHERHFRHYGQMVDAQNQLVGWNEYLKLADELKIDAPLCTAAYENGYDVMLEKHQRAARQLGFLELAVFVSIFCKRHGVEPENPLQIPANLYPKFEEAFEFKSGQWRIRQSEAGAYRKICERMFKGNDRALKCIEEVIPNMGYALPENINLPTELDLSSTTEDRDYCKGIFPNPSVIKEYIPLSPHGMADTDREVKDLDKEGEIRKEFKASKEKRNTKETFTHTVDEVLHASKDDLRVIAQRFPDEIEWHTLLLDENDPRRIAECIMNLFYAGSALCRSIAAHLLLFELGLNKDVMHKDWSIEKILRIRRDNEDEDDRPLSEDPMSVSDEPEACAVLASTRSRAIAVMRRLSARYMAYFHYYFAEQDSTPVIELLEEASTEKGVPKIFHVSNWHPILRADSTNWREDILDDLCHTESNQREKAVDYLLRRNVFTTSEDWNRALTHIKVSLSDEYSDKLIASLLTKSTANEAVTAGCIEYMARHLQPHKLFEELNKSQEKKWEQLGDKEKRNIVEQIDIPLSIFLKPDTDELDPPSGWEEVRAFAEIAPPHIRSAITEMLVREKETYASDLFPESFTGDGISFVFTKQDAITEKDLPLIRIIARSPDHRLEKVIVEKAQNSSKKVQEEITRILSQF